MEEVREETEEQEKPLERLLRIAELLLCPVRSHPETLLNRRNGFEMSNITNIGESGMRISYERLLRHGKSLGLELSGSFLPNLELEIDKEGRSLTSYPLIRAYLASNGEYCAEEAVPIIDDACRELGTSSEDTKQQLIPSFFRDFHFRCVVKRFYEKRNPKNLVRDVYGWFLLNSNGFPVRDLKDGTLTVSSHPYRKNRGGGLDYEMPVEFGRISIDDNSSVTLDFYLNSFKEISRLYRGGDRSGLKKLTAHPTAIKILKKFVRDGIKVN